MGPLWHGSATTHVPGYTFYILVAQRGVSTRNIMVVSYIRLKLSPFLACANMHVHISRRYETLF